MRKNNEYQMFHL